MTSGNPTRSEIAAADDWWASLTDRRRASLHRWQTGKGPAPAPMQDEALIDVDGTVHADAIGDE